MINLERLRSLAKAKGLSLSYICAQIGVARVYFIDVERYNRTIPEDRLAKIAELLGTTVEYLTDQTDDPSPQQKKPALTESQIDLDEIDPVKAELIKSVLSMKREDVEKISQFFDLLKKS